MIKASVLVQSYNCNDTLPNTLYSISRQKTNFDFEVCFLDDCSYEDPKPIYDEFLNVKYKKGWRLKQHIGSLGDSRNFPHMIWFKNSFAMALDMIDKNSEIIIFHHGDILTIDDNVFQKFVDRVNNKEPQIPNVYTVNVPNDLYLHYEDIKNFEINEEHTPLYQGVNRCSLAPTLMALTKHDVYELEYDKNTHECNIAILMKQYNYKLVAPGDIIGIHQLHKYRPSAHIVNEGCLLNWTSDCPEKVIYQ